MAAAKTDVQTVELVRHTKAPCKLLKLDLRLPKPTDYLYEMAGAVLWNDWAHAMQTIQVEASKQPQNPGVRLIYAHILTVSGDLILAYGEATAAERLNPGSPYAHAQRSTICYHAGLTECAIHEALRFQEMRGEDASAYIVLGHGEELQGHEDEALEAYTQAKKWHAGYAEIYAGLGESTGGQVSSKKRWRALTKQSSWTSGRPDNYCDLAQWYEAESYAGKAIKRLKEAKEREPENPQISMALGNAYLAGERYAEAAHEYQELLEAAPAMDKRDRNWRRHCARWGARPRLKRCSQSQFWKARVGGSIKATAEVRSESLSQI